MHESREAAGLMILFYDHLLTFGDEVELIWTAPATYAKYTFLLNRYSVLATLLAVAYGAFPFFRPPLVCAIVMRVYACRDLRVCGNDIYRPGASSFDSFACIHRAHTRRVASRGKYHPPFMAPWTAADRPADASNSSLCVR